MIRYLRSAFTVMLSILLCLGAMSPETLAQPEDVEERVLRAIASGDVTIVEDVLESTRYDVRQKIGKTTVSVFNFAMFCDNVDVFRAVMRRALPVTPDDLEVAASAGNSAQFLAVLRAATWRDFEQYKGGAGLLTPMSSESREMMRSLLLSKPIDRLKLLSMRRNYISVAPDLNALNLWIERLKDTAPANIINQFLMAKVLEAVLYAAHTKKWILTLIAHRVFHYSNRIRTSPES